VIDDGDRVDPIRMPSTPGRLPLSPAHLQGLLVLAAIACCVAMSMPQVHIIAYCGDLGYGTARGAEMLSIMLGLGVVSRLGSGSSPTHRRIEDTDPGFGAAMAVADRLSAVRRADVSLHRFGDLRAVARRIVPNYALVVREYFPRARRAPA